MWLDAEYYISKTLIPPLERIFNLMGANVRNWYDDMPKFQRTNERERLNIRDLSRRPHTTTLHSYIKSRICAVCKVEDTDEGIVRIVPVLTRRSLQKLSRDTFRLLVCSL
jgi:DNA polymerase zeta